MYGLHTGGTLTLVEGGRRIERDFRKRDEEKCSDAVS